MIYKVKVDPPFTKEVLDSIHSELYPKMSDYEDEIHQYDIDEVEEIVKEIGTEKDFEILNELKREHVSYIEL